MRVLMFGWEFPPHILGVLGTACYGLTKALSGFEDVEVTFVVPRIWGDEDLSGATMLGANEIQVIQKPVLFPDSKSKVEYYELNSALIPYLGTCEFYELKTNLSGRDTLLVETTGEGKILFAGDYTQSLFQEIEYYALVAESIAKEFSFDVIHAHDWMTFPAGIAVQRISGKPLIVHVHSTEFDRSGSNVNPAICRIEKEGMRMADELIVVSNYTKNTVVDKYGINSDKITTVYNAVEPLTIQKNVSFDRNNVNPVVTFLGRITSQKGPEYFLEAAKLVLREMGNVRFVMAGKGDLLNAMIGRAEELGIVDSITFPGFLDDTQIQELFDCSDVFVMPSVSEPFGIVALEAIQAGVPVIISRQSGVSEILENAFSVNYWDIQEIADVICNLLADRQLRCQLIDSGITEVSKLLWSNAAAEVRKTYLRVLTRERL